MTGLPIPAAVALGADALDALLPMHAQIDPAGRVTHLGPTLGKLCAGRELLGRTATEAMLFTRPGGIGDPAALLASAGRPLRLRLRQGRQVQFRGVLAPLAQGGGILSLSLALSELGDLGGAGLTCTDFSATDMTVDMLYLIEAKTAAMDETRNLVTRLFGAKAVAEEQAFTDTLTGLSNRRAFEGELQRLASDRRSFAISHVDLDFFKQVNDRLGHAAGDHVLQQVARLLQQETRASDVVARVGGDEFVILFRNLVDPERLERVGQRIIGAVEQPIAWREETCRISASIGTALSLSYDLPDPVRMLADADAALYRAKALGRAQHVIFAGSGEPRAAAGEPGGGIARTG